MMMSCFFFFQAEDGIRDLVRSRGLGDVYKRQMQNHCGVFRFADKLKEGVSKILAVQKDVERVEIRDKSQVFNTARVEACLLYTSDAADERSSVDLGGRRIIKKKNNKKHDRR